MRTLIYTRDETSLQDQDVGTYGLDVPMYDILRM